MSVCSTDSAHHMATAPFLGVGGGGRTANLLLNWLLKWILRLAILNLILALDPNMHRKIAINMIIYWARCTRQWHHNQIIMWIIIGGCTLESVQHEVLAQFSHQSGAAFTSLP